MGEKAAKLASGKILVVEDASDDKSEAYIGRRKNCLAHDHCHEEERQERREKTELIDECRIVGSADSYAETDKRYAHLEGADIASGEESLCTDRFKRPEQRDNYEIKRSEKECQKERGRLAIPATDTCPSIPPPRDIHVTPASETAMPTYLAAGIGLWSITAISSDRMIGHT